MREIGNDELRKIQLDILVDFARFCDENKLTYFLAGGTLLGAVRHKGFIPWDDDIDVMMPRKDYERFVKTYRHKFYKANWIASNKNYVEKFTKVCDLRTYLVNENYKEHEVNDVNCVFIDVFPIDGMPNGKLKQKLLIYFEQFLIGCHSASVLKYKISSRYNDKDAGFLSWRKYFRTVLKFIMISFIGNTNPRFWANLIDKFARLKEYDTQEEVASIVAGNYGLKEIVPRSIYMKKKRIKFENNEFFVPEHYECYLINLYGNTYMELPPIDKRASHHNFKAYWKR